MTFSVGHVAGGTNAGWRWQKPAPKPWECGCVEGATTKHYRVQPAHMVRCHVCGQERP